eukprot:154406_1
MVSVRNGADCEIVVTPLYHQKQAGLGEQQRSVNSVSVDGPKKRVFEVWPGRNSPLCGGACLFGPHQYWFSFTLFLLVVNSALFIYFTALRIHLALVIFLTVISTGTAILLLVTTFTEPGIIPRAPKGTFCPQNENPYLNAPKIEVEGRLFALSYCSTCHIYRPPRTKHCRVCDNCVEEFDHHCQFVANDIGRRNYRYFFGFVFLCGLVVFTIFVASLGILIYDWVTDGFFELLTVDNIVSMYLVVVSVMCSGVIMLCRFHCYLLSRGTTTNEYIKGYFGNRAPQDKPSLFMNLFALLSRQTPPTKVPLRASANSIFIKPPVDSGASTLTSEPQGDESEISGTLNGHSCHRPSELVDRGSSDIRSGSLNMLSDSGTASSLSGGIDSFAGLAHMDMGDRGDESLFAGRSIVSPLHSSHVDYVIPV